MSRILAIDYGTKRTGIAATDPLQIIATAVDTVPTHTLLDWLKGYLAKEVVSTIVVGAPTQTDGSPSATAPAIKGLVRKLKTTYPQMVIEQEDERFTSLMAHQTIQAAGMGKALRQNKGLADQIAAVIILQSYLERKAFEKNRG